MKLRLWRGTLTANDKVWSGIDHLKWGGGKFIGGKEGEEELRNEIIGRILYVDIEILKNHNGSSGESDRMIKEKIKLCEK